MKITKHIHSCLTFEQDGEKLLFDPGLFTFLEGRVQPDQFADVATVVITHEHVDHLYVKALKEILALSKARLISNRGVAAVLRPEGIAVELHEEGTLQAGPFTLKALETAHQPILIPGPAHTSYLIDDRVLNPGDSFDPKLQEWKGVETLILPIMAPFLTEVEAVAFARRMEPKQVLPVHDGYAKDFFVKSRQEAYEGTLKNFEIRFHRLTEVGAGVEI
jgi:L-ascorbate metabolism protein UlaG (beta-lactamase superfamily)